MSDLEYQRTLIIGVIIGASVCILGFSMMRPTQPVEPKGKFEVVDRYQGRQYGGGVFGGGGFIGETTYCDAGTASRFFYSTKSSVKERTHGRTVENNHPTVKNLELMKYLIKLVTPKGGTVYDPFAGSGTTLIAAKELDYNSVGVELSSEYCEIIKNRLNAISSPLEEFLVGL